MLDYDALDPGIRETVRWLVGHDFEPTDSGDGVSKLGTAAEGCALDFPHVFMAYPAVSVVAEASRLAIELRRAGVDVVEGMIQATFDPVAEVQVIALIGVDDSMLCAAKARVS